MHIICVYIYHHVTVSLESYYCILLLYIVVEYTASPFEEKAWPFSPNPHHLCGAVGIAIRFGRPGVHWVDANLVSCFQFGKQERDLLRKTCLFASTVLGDDGGCNYLWSEIT